MYCRNMGEGHLHMVWGNGTKSAGFAPLLIRPFVMVLGKSGTGVRAISEQAVLYSSSHVFLPFCLELSIVVWTCTSAFAVGKGE